jgi:tetratricopeptide (TPR) repeat protein
VTTRAALAVAALAATALAADPPGTPRSNEALAVCARAGKATSVEEKRKLYAHGLTLAEAAVKSDERDAKAHFAVFCNLGKEMQLRGVSVRSVTDVRRLRRAVDRTVELAPDYADALVGKGELLLDLPGVLGGDAKEGERLLRAALEVDPDYIGAHLGLARALDERGARDEARSEAERALALAERDGDQDQSREARDFLARLRRP